MFILHFKTFRLNFQPYWERISFLENFIPHFIINYKIRHFA